MSVKSKRQKLLKILNLKVFGVLNISDVIIIGLFVLALLAVFITKNGVPQLTQNTSGVEIDVFFAKEKLSGEADLFKPGKQTFITIRNIPYTKVDIVKSTKTQLRADNSAYPYAYNLLVTISDDAIITPDGPVIGGNKLKIGIPITLEGFNYKLSGVVSDVRIEKNAP